MNPSNQTVRVNTTASFFCRARGRNARWHINDTLVDSFAQATYEREGFTFTEETMYSESQNHVFNLNVTVIASAAVNTTSFVCSVTLDGVAISTPAQLIVMGKSSYHDACM